MIINNQHRITLPTYQAVWWRDIAVQCGLITYIGSISPNDTLKVTVYGPQTDIETAWTLFVEEFKRLIKL